MKELSAFHTDIKHILQNARSAELSQEFGQGFSYTNLRNFRQFYLTYPDQEICYTLCSKLSWSISGSYWQGVQMINGAE